MRDYGKLLPTFWTRGSGRALRGHKEAQILAAYLFSAPSSNMLGLFYVPLPTIMHETGLTAEEVRVGMRRLAREDIAHHDAANDIVWVVTGIVVGTASSLQPNDNRAKSLNRELASFGNHMFTRAILDRYAESHCLDVPGVEPEPLPPFEDPSEGVPDPFEGPSKPVTGSGSGSGSVAVAGVLRSPTAPRGKKPKTVDPKAVPFPDEFEPSAEDYAEGRENGFDREAVDRKVERIRNWANGDNRDGKIKKNTDWHRRFRQWIRDDADRDRDKGIDRDPLPPEPPRRPYVEPSSPTLPLLTPKESASLDQKLALFAGKG